MNSYVKIYEVRNVWIQKNIPQSAHLLLNHLKCITEIHLVLFFRTILIVLASVDQYSYELFKETCLKRNFKKCSMIKGIKCLQKYFKIYFKQITQWFTCYILLKNTIIIWYTFMLLLCPGQPPAYNACRKHFWQKHFIHYASPYE